MKRNPIGKHRTTIGANTDGMTCVRYHATDVVCFDSSRIILRSGGWMTATTKKRMNQAAQEFNLGFSVTQKNREWTVRLADGRTLPFTDGMVIQRVRQNPHKRGGRALSVPEQHQLRIARDTWRNPLKGRFMGGPTAEEAREIIKRLTGKDPGPSPNPHRRASKKLPPKQAAWQDANRKVQRAFKRARKNPAPKFLATLTRKDGSKWYYGKTSAAVTTVRADAKRFRNEMSAIAEIRAHIPRLKKYGFIVMKTERA